MVILSRNLERLIKTHGKQGLFLMARHLQVEPLKIYLYAEGKTDALTSSQVERLETLITDYFAGRNLPRGGYIEGLNGEMIWTSMERKEQEI